MARRSRARRSAERAASAITVTVGFFSAPVVKQLASTDEDVGNIMKSVEAVGHAEPGRGMHAGRAAIVLGCSGDKSRDDFSDRAFVPGVLHQLHQVLARFDHIVQNFFIEPDVNFQGGEAKLVLVVFGGSDVVFLFRHHCAEDLHAKIGRLLSKADF
jgi:hypothetical protein